MTATTTAARIAASTSHRARLHDPGPRPRVCRPRNVSTGSPPYSLHALRATSSSLPRYPQTQPGTRFGRNRIKPWISSRRHARPCPPLDRLALAKPDRVPRAAQLTTWCAISFGVSSPGWWGGSAGSGVLPGGGAVGHQRADGTDRLGQVLAPPDPALQRPPVASVTAARVRMVGCSRHSRKP